MDNGHNKPTKRKNSDEEDYDGDQAYLVRYKINREEILKRKIFFLNFLMMMSGDEEKFSSKLSTFAIQKGIQGLVGESRTIKRQRSGDLLIEIDRKTHSTKLLAITEFAHVLVKVSPHRTLNTSKKSLRTRNIAFLELGKLLKGLTNNEHLPVLSRNRLCRLVARLMQ